MWTLSPFETIISRLGMFQNMKQPSPVFEFEQTARASILFTSSQMKSFVLLATLFGLLTSLAGGLFRRQTPLDLPHILSRVPYISIWVWFQILAFDVDNQKSPKERNLLNIWGFLCYNMSTVRVAKAGLNSSCGSQYVPWVLMLAAAVFTSVHMQGYRGAMGDEYCGVATLYWSLIAPALWGFGILVFAVPSLLGAYIAGKLLLDKAVKSDELLWMLWSFWLIVLYTLPLTALLRSQTYPTRPPVS